MQAGCWTSRGGRTCPRSAAAAPAPPRPRVRRGAAAAPRPGLRPPRPGPADGWRGRGGPGRGSRARSGGAVRSLPGEPAGAAVGRAPPHPHLVDGQAHGVAEGLQQRGARGAGGHGEAGEPLPARAPAAAAATTAARAAPAPHGAVTTRGGRGSADDWQRRRPIAARRRRGVTGGLAQSPPPGWLGGTRRRRGGRSALRVGGSCAHRAGTAQGPALSQPVPACARGHSAGTFFAGRAIRHRSGLPRAVVESLSLEVLRKNRSVLV